MISEDPKESLKEKIEQETIKPQEEFDFSKLPHVPLFQPQETNQQPITNLLDDGQTIQIIPQQKEITDERQLSDRLEKLFPDIEKITKKPQKTLTDLSTEIIPSEFDFFTGGFNETFNHTIRSLIPQANNFGFLDFLQSNYCKNILEDNKLKIHIDTGNIYYNNIDTNESIHNFIFNQENPINGEINYEFTFDQDYVTYFYCSTDTFNESVKNKLDILTNKNSKFLFYRYNDYLKQQKKEPVKVKHSLVTEDI